MQASAPTSFRALPLLRRGNTGNDVRLLQQRLNAVRDIPGLTGLPELAVDGIFGPRTETAVRQFQDWLNLLVDGIVGPQTWGTVFRLSFPDALGISETANVRPFRVAFITGTRLTVVENSSVRGDLEVYVLQASARQRLTLAIRSAEDNAEVTAVVAPNNAILSAAADGSVGLPLTGDYFVIVGKTRGNASYQLTLRSV